LISILVNTLTRESNSYFGDSMKEGRTVADSQKIGKEKVKWPNLVGEKKMPGGRANDGVRRSSRALISFNIRKRGKEKSKGRRPTFLLGREILSIGRDRYGIT